jgi:vitamin B12 transporter
MRVASAGCAGLLLSCLVAQAEPEAVIVTATRLDATAGANASVLDAATIASRQAGSIVDLLRDFPGVFVQQSGGSVVSLFTRGAKPNFTLVLLDGVKANDPTNTRGGSYDFSTLDLNDIERIEFVRGPASAIYGSDAVGGVINIISRKGGPAFDAGADVEGGSFGYARASGHVGGPLSFLGGGATANLGVAYTDNGMPVDGSTARGLSLDGSLALPQVAGVALSLNGRFSSSVAGSFPDSSGGPRLAVLRTLDHRDIDESVLGAHARRAIINGWDMALDYGYYGRQSDAVSPGVAPSPQTPTGIPANGDKARFNRHQVTWTNRLNLGAVQAAVGIDMQTEHGVDDGYLNFGFRIPTHFALNRTLWAGFGEMRWRVDEKFSLSASGRYDDAGGKTHFSPQLRADYTVLDGTALQVSWGRAYKLPSFYALGNPIVGDPNLKPEDAETFEGGVTQALGDFGAWKAEAFATNYSNLIDFRPGAVPKLINLSRVHVRGIETSLALPMKIWGGDITATPRLSYTNARNQATNAALRDVPSWLAGATLLWRPTTDWDVSFDVSHVGALVDNAVPTGDVRLGGHVRADLAASYAMTQNIKLHLGVDNLFDTHYEDIVGFPAPGAVVRGGISAAL